MYCQQHTDSTAAAHLGTEEAGSKKDLEISIGYLRHQQLHLMTLRFASPGSSHQRQEEAGMNLPVSPSLDYIKIGKGTR